jgi:hypothetical protein
MNQLLPVLVPIGLAAVILYTITRIRYVVDDRYLRVIWFGVTFRKIALADIAAVSTNAPLWNEHWCNTLWARGRIVCLRRRTGVFRNFIITPINRDEFVRDLRQKLGQSD